MIGAAAHDFESWRDTARRLLGSHVVPERVCWTDGSLSLFEDGISIGNSQVSVPADFLRLAEKVALHRDGDRWALLYRVLYRITHSEKQLLRIDVDDDVRRLRLMEKAVSRDLHKMTAFVRFRRVENSGEERFVAWHRPDHHIVEAIAPWFARRFGNMRWSILTPERSVHWDVNELTFSKGVPRSEAPDGDALEDLWRDYYGSIFNPARVNLQAMKAEMPVRHWATLPEAQIISDLLTKADGRVSDMAASQKNSALAFVPQGADLDVLAKAANGCRGCDLYERATQVVFGEGPAQAPVVMVGEQPGDEEDLKGRPFIGPAGRLLDRAMHDADFDRKQIYVTNAVKHFKWTERGKRRIHAKPGGTEISACRPWLEAELAAVNPKLIVCLGSTAAQSLMGRDVRILKDRGIFFPHRWAKEIVATIHPSAILRMPDRQEEEYELFVRDLKLIAARARELAIPV